MNSFQNGEEVGFSRINKRLLKLLPSGTLQESGKITNGWVTLSGHSGSPSKGVFVGWQCYLIPREAARPNPSSTIWQARGLGEFSSSWPYSGPNDTSSGLTETIGNSSMNFLAQGRSPVGASKYEVDIDPTFLWFWDAYSVGKTWKFIDSAGEEHELIRYEVSADTWKIEFRVEHLRTYLHYLEFRCLIEIDASIALQKFQDFSSEMRIEDSFQDDWGRYEFLETYVDYLSAHGDWTLTQYLSGYTYIEGRKGKVSPRALAEDDEIHPEFLIGLDEEENELYWSSNPEGLKNYFGGNPDAPYFLTPIYFNAEVLDKYRQNLERYEVSDGRISCLNLWSIEISRNGAGLVVAYLGDIGKRLPSSERRRWKLFNVSPEGGIDEGRFRRDFLNQPASSPNARLEISRAVDRLNVAFESKFGFPLVREPNEQLRAEIRNLVAPTTSSSSRLNEIILILTKWLIDGIDSKSIKNLPGTSDDAPSLKNLKALLDGIDIEVKLATVLQDLQSFRSRGGVAHSPNSDSMKARKVLGMEGDDARLDFSSLKKELIQAFEETSDQLLQRKSEENFSTEV